MPEQPLRLLIDGRKLNHGGIGVYTSNLIAGLLDVAPQTSELDLAVMGDPAVIEQFGWSPHVDVLADTTPLYSFAELWKLGQKISATGRAFHTPHYVLPFHLTVPSFVTIHDLIHITAPQHWYYPIIAKRLLRSALRRANHVFTVSEASARDIRELVDDTRLTRKITVLPNVLNPDLTQQGTIDREHPYLLAVISMNKPHKGIDNLFAAFAKLRADPAWAGMWRKTRLVVVGQESALIQQRGVPEGVEVLGTVSTGMLGRLYSEATALVLPSRLEGFSLPALEAQCLGSAVVAGPVPAVKELLTGFDVVCEDFSAAALCEGIKEILRRRLVEGEERTDVEAIRTRFDRRLVAQRFLTIYRHTLSEFGANRSILASELSL